MTEEETTTATTRQRRKRKWDQPAEAIVSAAAAAMPGMLPFTAAGALAGMGTLAGGFPYMNYFPALSTTAVQPAAAQITPAATVQQNAAAIVQKFNQDLASKGLILQAKMQDEHIAREITINDADPGVRYKLTKRQTQEEIQLKTGAVVITRGRYRPPNGPAEHEKPLYLHISAGVNLKETAERIKAVDQAAAMVEEMLKQGQQTHMPIRNPPLGAVSNGNVPMLLTKNIFVGFEADPSFNLTGRIRGPNDQYIHHIMNETGATVVLWGRGSGNKEGPGAEESHQPLHLLISSDNVKSLEDAKTLAENLLETIRADSFPYRLPPYQVLPPAVPSVGPPTLMSYPNPQQAPYQANGANPSPSPYGGYYPSAGLYTPPYVVSQPPFPAVTRTVAASLDQPAPPSVDSYANMLPSTKVYGAVPPPTEFVGDHSTRSTEDATQSSSQKELFGRLRERFAQSINDSTSHSPTRVTPSPLNSTASSQTQASALLAGHSSISIPDPISSQFLHQHLNGVSSAPASTIQVPQTSQVGMPGQSVAPIYSQTFGQNHTQAPMTTSYSGYGGVYPEVTPLQQVAQALQRPPLPVSVKPLPNSAFLATLTKAQSSSFQEKLSDKQPVQRRKFQEFPVAGKDSPGEEQQGRRRMISSGSDTSIQSQVPSLPSSNSMPPPPSRSMPPPPPKFMPPPKSSAASARTASPPSVQLSGSVTPSVSAGSKQPNEHAARHGTGLKLVEYGEEEEESFAGQAVPSQSKPFTNGKPFWAA